MNNPRIIISGGGTGGHIFPALSIAGSIRELCPEAEILFVGAEGKMEMERVPAAGYRIIGLPVAGLQRSLSPKNLALPFKVAKSIRKAGEILEEFKPDVAVGVGGYASAPLLWSAQRKGIPCLIQEQNSYAGLTNKILAKRAARICTAYEGMERFFPADRIILTGGIAYSKYISDYISEHVSFIAPVEVMPGEFEMEALAAGCLRVLRGEEELQDFGEIAASAEDRISIVPGVKPGTVPVR